MGFDGGFGVGPRSRQGSRPLWSSAIADRSHGRCHSSGWWFGCHCCRQLLQGNAATTRHCRAVNARAAARSRTASLWFGGNKRGNLLGRRSHFSGPRRYRSEYNHGSGFSTTITIWTRRVWPCNRERNLFHRSGTGRARRAAPSDCRRRDFLARPSTGLAFRPF